MRFEVPQFIDVEDKIFGPLTWKQFIYLAGGAGAGFILFVFLPFFLFIFVAVPLGALAVGLAFYNFNNRPLSVLIEAITMYFGRSRLYLWKKEKILKAKEAKGDASAPAPAVNLGGGRNNITSLARKLELNALNNEKNGN